MSFVSFCLLSVGFCLVISGRFWFVLGKEGREVDAREKRSTELSKISRRSENFERTFKKKTSGP